MATLLGLGSAAPAGMIAPTKQEKLEGRLKPEKLAVLVAQLQADGYIVLANVIHPELLQVILLSPFFREFSVSISLDFVRDIFVHLCDCSTTSRWRPTSISRRRVRPSTTTSAIRPLARAPVGCASWTRRTRITSATP